MAYPEVPRKGTSYTAKAQAQGDGSFPGADLDVDLNALFRAYSDLLTFIRGALRPDGRIQSGLVGRDAFSSEVSLGFSAPTTWQTDTAYAPPQTVFQGTKFYICTQPHTSDVFSTDFKSGRWALLVDLSPAGALLSTNNLSDLENSAAARTALGLGALALLSVAPIASGGTGATTARAALTNLGVGETGRAVFAAETQAIARDDLGATLIGQTLFTAPSAKAASDAVLPVVVIDDFNAVRDEVRILSLAATPNRPVNEQCAGHVIRVDNKIIVTVRSLTTGREFTRTSLDTGATWGSWIEQREVVDNATFTASPSAAPTRQNVADYVDATGIGRGGQRWFNVAANRSGGTTYQNTTGRPILVSVRGDSNTGALQVSHDNSLWIEVARLTIDSSNAVPMQALVPPGHWYKTTGSAFDYWAELR